MLGSYNKILLTFDEHALWICICGKGKQENSSNNNNKVKEVSS